MCHIECTRNTYVLNQINLGYTQYPKLYWVNLVECDFDCKCKYYINKYIISICVLQLPYKVCMMNAKMDITKFIVY